MISLFALVFCVCIFLFTITALEPNFFIVVIQIGCILANIPGTLAFFGVK